MPVERMPEERPDRILQHTGTHRIDRANALGHVLRQFGLDFRVVAKEGARYPDGNAQVPKGEAFVTCDTGEIPTEAIWRLVDKIAPLLPDGIR